MGKVDSLATSDILPLHTQLLEHMLEGVLLIRTSDRIIVYTSPVFDRMLGYQPGELIGRPALTIVRPQSDKTGDDLVAEFDQSISQSGQWSGEVQKTRKDGTPLWCLVRVSTFEHPEFGQVWLSMHQDITERRQADNELEASQRRLLAAQSIAHLGTWEINVESQMGYWSPEMFSIHGWDIELGAPPFDRFLQMIYPDDRPMFESTHENVIRERVSASIDYRIIRPDGQIRTVNAVINALPNPENRVILAGTLLDITERKLVEAKLLEERNLLMTLINNIPEHVYVKDSDSRFILANAAAIRHLGASSLEEVVGKTDFDFSPRDLALQYYAGEQDLFDHGTPILNQEQRIYDHATDRFRWMTANKIPLRDAQGQITRLVGMNHDITERKEAQDALSHMAAIVEYSNDAIISKTPDNFITTWNRGAERMYGYTASEMVGQPLSRLIPPEKVEEISALLENVRQGHPVEYFETVRIRKDGKRIDVSLALSPIMDSRGRVVSISSIARDITPLKSAQQALLQQEELYRTLVHNLPESAVMLFDHDLRFLVVDGPSLEKQGYSKEKMEGRNLWDVVPAQAEALAPYYQRALAGERVEFEWESRDKSVFFAQIVPVRNASDDIFGGLLVVQDITERKRIEREIVDARNRAEQANRLKSSFLTTVSHELRTPLNAVIGFSDALLKGMLGEVTDLQRQYIQDILSNGEHQLVLINSLLDLSKIEAGQFELHFSELSLGQLLSHVSRHLSSLAENKGLQYTTYLDPTIPPLIVGDELRLKQILINLISNAIKFTRKGVIEVRFERENETAWTMSVRDTGIGIPPEAFDYLFDEFRQVDNSLERAYEGSGLGLSIVRKLVSLMDGTVDLQSQVGQGSTFTVHLPIKPVTENGVGQDHDPIADH